MRLPGNEDDQDVLELTEIAGPAPVSRWTRRHTRHLCTALAAVAGLVAFVGAAASPTMDDDGLHLGAVPPPIWSTRLREGENAVALGSDLIGIQEPPHGRAGAGVRGLDAESGDVRWRYRLTGAASAFVVRDLPGTGWVALQAGQQVTLLDRLTGERQFRFDVPVSDAGVGWFGSSDRGSLLVAVPTNGVGGPALRVTRLAAPSPYAVVWSRQVPMSEALNRAMRNPVVIERDGMLLLRTAYGWRGQQEYTLGIRAADGAVPRWLADGPAFQVVDGVAVLTGTDGWSLDTWRRLWHREEKWGHGYVVGDALLLESPGSLQRVDPWSGATRWTLTDTGIFTRVTQFEGRLILYSGAQTLFPERGTAGETTSGSWVQAYDMQTGERLWHTVTPAPVLDVLRGNRTLIVRMCDPGTAVSRFSVASITADGRIAWVRHDTLGSWSMPRFGPHLATLGRDGTLSVWG